MKRDISLILAALVLWNGTFSTGLRTYESMTQSNPLMAAVFAAATLGGFLLGLDVWKASKK